MRGLKLGELGQPLVANESHPIRVRGLKLSYLRVVICGEMSHPIRVRGLKQFVQIGFSKGYCVAPYTGAWIETLKIVRLHYRSPGSHPIRVRGLKQVSRRENMADCVAPYTGAWIETHLDSC